MYLLTENWVYLVKRADISSDFITTRNFNSSNLHMHARAAPISLLHFAEISNNKKDVNGEIISNMECTLFFHEYFFSFFGGTFLLSFDLFKYLLNNPKTRRQKEAFQFFHFQ